MSGGEVVFVKRDVQGHQGPHLSLPGTLAGNNIQCRPTF